ncbi:uncharacterized protein UV8b_03729 [Ustilaginoidea virens]|uniref:Uncharacterized protein n=1 Tax=Ustilaginoidea virens TaxID=1159556 RepID=A0A8E5MGF8_USTVR|nr:uncharacterized protein UV8b_03729 [Ustilaginoidea virens]QUC19488.1 hypothetical protein UV8b_03729 [Ustilaginoidea virens]
MTPLSRCGAGADPVSRTAAAAATTAAAIIITARTTTAKTTMPKRSATLDKGVSADLARGGTAADPCVVARRTARMALRAMSDALGRSRA